MINDIQETLKDCPLCDSPAYIKNIGVRIQADFVVGCEVCRLSISGFTRAVEAVEAWNARPREVDLKAEVESLRCCGNCRFLFLTNTETVPWCDNKESIEYDTPVKSWEMECTHWQKGVGDE
jgi:hypothetical protein